MTMSRPCSLQMPCPEDDPMAMRRARQAASETTFAEATCGTSHEIELSSTFPVRQSPEPSADFDITQSSTSTIYARLPDARSYIRLLKFQTPQTFNSTAVDVCCVLQTFPLAQLPPYKAISYTWGPEEPTAAIRIDDYLRDVRLNCETVLRRVRQQDAASFYWIDAVCIDQRNLDEKGHQVALMENCKRMENFLNG